MHHTGLETLVRRVVIWPVAVIVFWLVCLPLTILVDGDDPRWAVAFCAEMTVRVWDHGLE